MKTAGLFFSPVRSARIDRAFLRLVAETAGLVEWRFVYNPVLGAHPETTFDYPEPGVVMPGRYAAMLANGEVQDGYLDVALIPCALGLNARFVWVMEHDIDYPGRWSDVFGEFEDDDADLVTSTVARRAESPWSHWGAVAAPAWVPAEYVARSVNPLMRLSRGLLRRYALMMADEAWRGHYEFTLVSSALASGSRVADLSDRPTFIPPTRLSLLHTQPSTEGLASTKHWHSQVH